MEAAAKMMAEENYIMMADLNSMDPIQRACFDKKQMVI
jgi:hypothetical protein